MVKTVKQQITTKKYLTMLYSKRTVSSSAIGLSKEEAQESLERSSKFAPGTEILDITRRGSKWVATLLEPRTAEFPPSKDDDSGDKPKPDADFQDDDGSDDSDDSDTPDSPPSDDSGDKPPKKEGEKGELGELLQLIHAIADHLGIGPGATPGSEGGPMPGMDVPPPPPVPGPPGAGGPPGHPSEQTVLHKRVLKPGEVPPGGTPVGAPAFSHVTDLSRVRTFDAFDDTANKSIKQAKEELEALYGPQGFKVRQIKRVEGGRRIAAKLSR